MDGARPTQASASSRAHRTKGHLNRNSNGGGRSEMKVQADGVCFMCRKKGRVLSRGTCSNAVHFKCLDPPRQERSMKRELGNAAWKCYQCMDKESSSSRTRLSRRLSRRKKTADSSNSPTPSPTHSPSPPLSHSRSPSPDRKRKKNSSQLKRPRSPGSTNHPEEAQFKVLRRGTRTRTKVNYGEIDNIREYDSEDVVSWESSEEEEEEEGPEGLFRFYVEKQFVLEKILDRRSKTHEEHHKQLFSPTKADTDKQPASSPKEEVFEYLVKYKGLSYLHVAWVDEHYILSQSLGKQRLQRFLNKYDPDERDEPFPENFTSVERLLLFREVEEKPYYFVKWGGTPSHSCVATFNPHDTDQAGLSYDQCTWEKAEDINDDAKIDEYQRKKVPPTPQECVIPPRRKASAYKIIKDRTFKNENKLRPYQLEGLNWLVFSWYQQRNTILADEMGLGKTVQSVSIIHHLSTYEKIRGPFIIIVPLSTISVRAQIFEC